MASLEDPARSASNGYASVEEAIASRGDEPFEWSTLSDDALWEYVASLDSTVLVGLKEPGRASGVVNGRSVVPEHLWSVFAAQLEQQGAEVIYTDDIHPLVRVRLSDGSHVRRLRRLPVVSYVEPALFDERTFALQFGCGTRDDYRAGRTIAPGDRMPYMLSSHRVDRAWPYSTGQGETVGVIDTGTSVSQTQLTTQFASGLSMGRTVVHDYTAAHPFADMLPEIPAWHDSCRHGTKALGLIAAPRNGSSIVGVAYGANAYAVRAMGDVAAIGGWLEIRDAITRAIEDHNAKIVNMSFGTLGWSQPTRDLINFYAGESQYRTLFFAAAGTSTFLGGGAVFPSNMDAVVAVTGLSPTMPFPYAKCTTCHTSDKVEFSAFTLGESTGSGNNEIDGFGGSSAATAIMSGIAALVWSRYPSWSREQVLARMRAAAPFANRERGLGHGPVNAVCAVGGVCSATVSAIGTARHGQTITLSVNPRVLDQTVRSRLTYSWSGGTSGQTTQHVVTACPGETAQYMVTIADPVVGAHESFFGEYTVLDDGTPVDGLCESTAPPGPDPNWP